MATTYVNSTQIWRYWVSTSASSATTNVWPGWNENYTACTSGTNVVTTNATWCDWNDDWQETEEQKALRLAQEEEYRVRRETEARDREAAKVRAETILRRHLSQVQEASYDRNGYFDLTVEGGDKPARQYRIYKGTHGNIKRVEDGREVESICVQPTGVPEADANLAQMLHLMHDEEGLRRTGNIRRLA